MQKLFYCSFYLYPQNNFFGPCFVGTTHFRFLLHDNNLFSEVSSYPLFQQLKQQRDKLKVYQKRIQSTLDRDTEIARQLLRDGKKE